jgi:hypothetical protein
MHTLRWTLCVLTLCVFTLTSGCGDDGGGNSSGDASGGDTSGSVPIDDPSGSGSTARPLTDASIGGPVLDLGPSLADLTGTQCASPQAERVEVLDLTDPREDHFTLWIPADLCHPRCVILRPGIGDHHIQDHVDPHREHATRTLAERHGCVALTGDYKWPFHNASSRKSGLSTEKALAAFADSLQLPELATAPIATLGFGGDPSQFTASFAQYAPDRVIAVAAWGSGSMSNTTPGLYFDGRLRLTSALPAWHDERFIAAREASAPVGVAIDPLVAHSWGNTKKLGLRYLDLMLTARLAPGVAAATSALLDLDLSTGWVGHNLTFEVAPATPATLSDPQYSWLPDEAFAQLWQQFMRTGQTHPNDADYPRNTPPPLPPLPLPSEGKGSPDAPFGTHTQGDARRDLDPLTDLPPPLTPRLLVSTYVGGAGDQFIREVGFTDEGEVFGEGEGFRVLYRLDDLTGRVEGDPNTHDAQPFNPRPAPVGPPGNQLFDPRTQTTYSVGYRQTGATEQTPFLHSSDGWKMWDHDDPLGDQRGNDVWLMPNGLIGFRGDSKAAHGGVLELDPADRSKPMPGDIFRDAWQPRADTSGSVAFLIDPNGPNGPTILSGSWMRRFSGFQAVDYWGRLYMTSTEDGRFDPDNPFRMHATGSAGLFVLDPQLRISRFNASLGGVCEGGTQALRKVAIQKNILVIAGTTCAPNLAVTPNAVQPQSGGAQDGMFFVIQLWEQ